MITAGYYILDSNPYTVLLISFIMNSAVHFVQFLWPIHHKVSNLTMIVFYKIVATSFNLEDGRKIKSGDKELDNHSKAVHLLKKPSFIEWVAYCFTPFGSISNSFYEYKFFDYILDLGNNSQKVSDKSRSKAIGCLLRSAIYGSIYFCFRHYFDLKFYESEFFLSLNIIIRIILVLFLGVIIFSKDFMFWKVVDASLYEAGLADSGITVPEDEYTSLTFEYLLSKKTIKDWSFSFNHTNEVFWLYYLSKRGPESGLGPSVIGWISYFAKVIYKGFYGGIMLASFEKSLFQKAEKVIATVVPRYTKSLWPYYLFAQITMTMNRTSMRFKTTFTFFYVNYVIYFVFWILSAIIVVAGMFLIKPEEAVQEKKEDDHAKKE